MAHKSTASNLLSAAILAGDRKSIFAAMWPLSAAVEETAAKAMISIDVPADYKWVLLALVGAEPA